MFAHLNPQSSDFGDICASCSPSLHQPTVQSSPFEPGHPRPCPSHSGRRARIDLGQPGQGGGVHTTHYSGRPSGGRGEGGHRPGDVFGPMHVQRGPSGSQTTTLKATCRTRGTRQRDGPQRHATKGARRALCEGQAPLDPFSPDGRRDRGNYCVPGHGTQSIYSDTESNQNHISHRKCQIAPEVTWTQIAAKNENGIFGISALRGFRKIPICRVFREKKLTIFNAQKLLIRS